MAYLLRHQAGNQTIRAYSTLQAARVGMRTSNRNAGYERVSRCSNGLTDMEWCKDIAADADSATRYCYAPYVVVQERA